MLRRNLLIILLVGLCGASSFDVPDCPANSDGVHIPHEDCTKYYVCDNGVAVEQICPPPLYFNLALDQCDFPENVEGCNGGTRPPPEGGNGTTSRPPTTPSPPTNSTTQAPPTNSTTQVTGRPTNSTTPPSNGTTPLPNGCPAEGVDKIPHPALCDVYFICVDGVPYEENCADGLQFNPIIKECDFPENVNCSDPGNPTTTELPGPNCPADGVHFLPYPGNCSLYYICVEGFPVLNRCADGTLFDPISLQCEIASNVNCTSANRTLTEQFELPSFNLKLEETLDSRYKCPTGVTRALIPSQNSCREYFICFDGSNLGTLECEAGRHFDFLSQSCVPQSMSSCFSYREEYREDEY